MNLEILENRDRKVCGIYNEACRARLLCEADLPLAKCVDIFLATEVSEKQLKSLHKEPMVAVAAHAVSRKRLSGKPEKLQGRVNRQQNVNLSSASATNQISCNNCGKQHEKGKCVAYNQTCYECRGRYHFAQYCTRRRRKTNVRSVEEGEEGRDLFLGIVSVDSVQDSPWT